MKDHTDILAAFGGPRPLARDIGIPPARACHWPARGIPSKYWPHVERLAAMRGIPITTADLSRLAPSGRAPVPAPVSAEAA